MIKCIATCSKKDVHLNNVYIALATKNALRMSKLSVTWFKRPITERVRSSFTSNVTHRCSSTSNLVNYRQYDKMHNLKRSA